MPQNYQFFGLLHHPHPVVSLSLRIDHEGPPGGVFQNDGVIYAEVVVGQLVLVGPLSDANWIAEYFL